MNEEKVELVNIKEENKKKKTLGKRLKDILEVITFGLLCVMTLIYTLIGIGYVRQQYHDSIKNNDSVQESKNRSYSKREAFYFDDYFHNDKITFDYYIPYFYIPATIYDFYEYDDTNFRLSPDISDGLDLLIDDPVTNYYELYKYGFLVNDYGRFITLDEVESYEYYDIWQYDINLAFDLDRDNMYFMKSTLLFRVYLKDGTNEDCFLCVSSNYYHDALSSSDFFDFIIYPVNENFGKFYFLGYNSFEYSSFNDYDIILSTNVSYTIYSVSVDAFNQWYDIDYLIFELMTIVYEIYGDIQDNFLQNGYGQGYDEGYNEGLNEGYNIRNDLYLPFKNAIINGSYRNEDGNVTWVDRYNLDLINGVYDFSSVVADIEDIANDVPDYNSSEEAYIDIVLESGVRASDVTFDIIGFDNMIIRYSDGVNKYYNDLFPLNNSTIEDDSNKYISSISLIFNMYDDLQDYKLGVQVRDSYTNGFDNGFSEGQQSVIRDPNNYGLYDENQYQDNYQNGYNQGSLYNSSIEERGFLLLFNSILNAPYNILNGILNFEIFGINLFDLVSFVLSLAIIGVVVAIIVGRRK